MPEAQNSPKNPEIPQPIQNRINEGYLSPRIDSAKHGIELAKQRVPVPSTLMEMAVWGLTKGRQRAQVEAIKEAEGTRDYLVRLQEEVHRGEYGGVRELLIKDLVRHREVAPEQSDQYREGRTPETWEEETHAIEALLAETGGLPSDDELRGEQTSASGTHAAKTAAYIAAVFRL